MKTALYGLAICSTFFLASVALAAPAALTAQQTLMKTCNADATAQKLKGDARKAFLKTCLSKKPAATGAAATTDTTKPSQQELMKTCNADATKQSLKGDARKSFMSTCLSGKSAAGTSGTTELTTPAAATAPVSSTQFSAEAGAKGHCPTDLVVWVNSDTKIYHFAGTSDYGKTKSGAYMCQKDADAAGDHAAKNEKPPAH